METSESTENQRTYQESMHAEFRGGVFHGDITIVAGESKRSEILKWISTIPYTEHHTRISTTRLPGTGEWLFQRSEYKEWLSSSVSKLLLLRGIPGAGKTFIASVAIDSFTSDSQLEKLAYFYCNRAEETRRDPETILSALVHQLVQTKSDKKMLLKPIVDAYESRRSQGQQKSKLSLLESQALLVELADERKQTTICIDALDEVEPSTRKNLLKALKFVIENSKNLVKIFATTRMDDDINRQFEMFPRIELQPNDNASDIERFIKERIQNAIKDGELLDGAVDDDLEAEICKVLGERSRGMFQLAALQITYLYGMTTEQEVRNGLRHLPGTLRNAYQEIHQRILAQPEARQRALKAFRWIKFSCEPVRSETLLDAVSADISSAGKFSHQVIQPNVLLKACQNLIILDKSLNVFRFAHLSVDEFFEDKLSPEDSHTEIAQACLSLICTQRAWEGYDLNVTTRARQHEDRHLLLYSAAFWPWHFARAKDCAILDTIWDAFVSGTNHQQWCEYSSEKVKRDLYHSGGVFWGRIEAHREQMDSILSCVCVFDISRKFVKIFDSCRPQSVEMHALLSTACCFGDLEISRLLIDKGTCVCATGIDGETPLHYAVINGRDEVAQLLIDKGADISAADHTGRTSLHAAKNKEVARLLIDKGADVSAADKDGETPLHSAVINGRDEVAQLLIDKGADVFAADNDGVTPLRCALDEGNEEVARLLIDKGADVSAADNNGRTPLHFAKSKEVARLLIDKGADVSAADNNGETPLHSAVIKGRNEVVRLLIDKGADVSAAGIYGQTPLCCAVINGSDEVARLLIDKGADVFAADHTGRPPLHYAVIIGRDEVVRLLIDKGADVSAADKDGVTPLRCALDERNEEVARLLISKGADVSTADKEEQMPLYCASSSGSDDVARLLIDMGADISAANNEGETPLHRALEQGNAEVARLLIDMGADVSAANNEGETPHHRALERGNAEVARLLIDMGADVSTADNNGRTPLHFAKSKEMTRLLIDKGADVSAADKDGETPLPYALDARNEKVV